MAALTALQRLMASPKTARFVETLRHADLPVNWADDPEIVSMAGDAYKELGTGSPFFRATFGNSKVVDKEGKPLVVYHGTHAKDDFSSFGTGKVDKPWLNQESFFFTDNPSVADTYAAPRTDLWGKAQYDENSRVYPVYLNMKKGLSVNAKGDNWNDILYKGDTWATDDLANLAVKKGKDGAIIKNVIDYGPGGYSGTAEKGTDYVVFRPEQIKSTYNRGTFNPADPNIYRGLIPMLAGGGALAAMSPGSAQASEAEWPKQTPDGRLIWPADMPGYRNTEPGLEAPLVDPVDIATAPIGMTTAAGKALAMAAEPGIAYGTDKALGALLGLFQRNRRTGGGGGV